MKTVRVAAAVIREGNLIFATRRGYGEHKGKWEFPGGKLEAGESAEEALRREIMEELNTNILVGDKIDTVEYDAPLFHLSMDCFWCKKLEGSLELKEAMESRWLRPEELEQMDWLPADRLLLDRLKGGEKP